MKWTQRHTLIAGVALIALTNAIALGGAAYNRTGEPDSTLRLSERELRPPYIWRSGKENSGLSLHLLWRVPPGAAQDLGAYYYAGNGGMPAWLDASKMTSLGFEKPAKDADAERGVFKQRQLPRDVLIVLELEGPAYRDVLERTAKAAQEVAAKNERGEGEKAAAEMMERETHRSSRLFAVDAGLDRAALRRQYPDRTRYAIVHGQVRPAWKWETKGAAGSIERLSASEVNVPLEFRRVFEGVMPEGYLVRDTADKHFEATLAFGRRLEPWLVSAARQ